MKVSELGEFGLIDRLAEMVARSRSKASAPWQKLIVDIGDDATAWQGDTSIQLAPPVGFPGGKPAGRHSPST